MTDKEFTLKVKGKYLIRIADEDDTIGIFRGYAAIGSDPALVIEMNEGKIRFIPAPQVIYIDVLEAPESEPEPEKKKLDVYYG